MTIKLEKRFAAEIRAETRGGARKLVGYAARYGVVADLGTFRERILPRAFAESIEKRGDILALLDHDPARVLGRTRSGTLTLQDGDDGLAFELSVPDTSAGRDALTLAERGDLGGASIGFIVEEESRDNTVRVVKRAQLFEISIVSAWPAYAETVVEARGAVMKPLAHAPRLGHLRRFLETV